MSTKLILLAFALGSFGAKAQETSNTVEKDASKVIQSESENPFTITNSLSYRTNPDNIQSDYNGEPVINGNTFYNTLSMTKTFSLSDTLTYTPNASATFVTDNQGESSDDLKNAAIENTLTYSKVEGNIEYGANLKANYNYGYTYKYKNGDRVAETPLEAYRRNDNHSTIGFGFNASLAATENYVVRSEIGYSRVDHVGKRVPYYADYIKNDHPNKDQLALHMDDDYTRDIYTAEINNQFILNDNVNFEVPFKFRRNDFQNFNAFNNNAEGLAKLGETRLVDVKTVGITANITVLDFNLSSGLETGRQDDKRSSSFGEDADYRSVTNTIGYNFTETLSFSATHNFQGWYYDFGGVDANERENSYSGSLTMSNIMNLPLDAELSYSLLKGQSNYASGVFENETTALNLTYRL